MMDLSKGVLCHPEFVEGRPSLSRPACMPPLDFARGALDKLGMTR
jgi:hypothetical protein